MSDRLIQGPFGRFTHIADDTLVVERKSFSHVAEDHLQLGKSVERPGEDQAQALRESFLVPSISRTAENVVLERLVVAGPCRTVVNIVHCFRWVTRMQVYGHTKCLGTCQEGIKVGMVEEFFSDEAIGHRSHKAIFPYGAFKFVR